MTKCADAIPDFQGADAVRVTEHGVHVLDVVIPRSDVADYLRELPEQDRPQAFVHAVEVGVFCLERARTASDTDFVKRQVEAILAEVAKVPAGVANQLLGKIGTGNGQVLAPVQNLLEQVQDVSQRCLREVKDLLTEEIDPGRETSKLGAALKRIRDLLDENRRDSVQSQVTEALKHIAAEDGVLAKRVKAAVAEAVKPLADEVGELSKEVRASEAVAEVIERTTEKGVLYEEQVVTRLRGWAQMVGGWAEHVGQDHRPGDVLVHIPAAADGEHEFRLIVEARDRNSQALGHRQILDTLTRAMAERDGNAAVYLSRGREGLAKEIGDWTERSCAGGRYLATTDEHLIPGVRYLYALHRWDAVRASKPVVDTAAVEAQLARLRTALGRFVTLNTQVGKGRDALAAIQTEAEGLRGEVRDALQRIEEALRVSPVP